VYSIMTLSIYLGADGQYFFAVFLDDLSTFVGEMISLCLILFCSAFSESRSVGPNLINICTCTLASPAFIFKG
jgi:hypothetical protein